MARYFTLVSRNNEHAAQAKWGIEFGDFDRDVVEEELRSLRQDAKREGDDISFKVLCTDSRQAAIDEAVLTLNS